LQLEPPAPVGERRQSAESAGPGRMIIGWSLPLSIPKQILIATLRVTGGGKGHVKGKP